MAPIRSQYSFVVFPISSNKLIVREKTQGVEPVLVTVLRSPLFPLRGPKEEFKREVSKHLTGKETEPWEILYFKAYKSQLPVIEQALETAGLMLGSDKSRGYCLEMICADFLAGVSLQAGNRDALLPCLTRLVVGLPKPQRKQLLEEVQVTL